MPGNPPPADVRITAEPIDTNRCKFVVSVPVLTGGVRRFSEVDDAKGSPLAEAIFAIPGLAVSELIVSGNIVTVVKRSAAPWQAVGKAVGSAIRTTLASDAPAVAASPKPASAVSDDALYEQVARVFDEQVNPMVARGMADVTLRQGIEGMLAQLVPAVRGIVDITDHTSGANPYFQAAKK